MCGRCGIYLGAVIKVDDKAYATLNIRTFDVAESFTQEPVALSYDGETGAERRARRAANWTPVVAFVDDAS